MNKENALNKEINSSLHLKSDDERWDLYEYINVFKQLKEISKLSLDMSYFDYYNLKSSNQNTKKI